MRRLGVAGDDERGLLFLAARARMRRMRGCEDARMRECTESKKHGNAIGTEGG